MNFDELKKKAQELVEKHGDKIEGAADKAGDFAKSRFGRAEQIDSVVNKAKGLLGSVRRDADQDRGPESGQQPGQQPGQQSDQHPGQQPGQQQ
ncbi:antitoxin [Goodfellowiella coeruleoviolacea]|uniref:MT0933-like antitoxin protein n=1 Tax=Goodfellowiella coeruleoviolacea TaxID=334858 RepID=A0AAE3KF23_9PSEU|nr:antitoxin [Goodfellowiella coeruleoviolacea]MCP2164450.1 MT0933-like antitoxin protein [Goodfellowiella coeruleoviolacea]